MSSRINKQTNKNKTSKNITKRKLRGYAATQKVALPENKTKKMLIQKKSKKIPTVHHHHE
jgi:hypothetical protein